MRKFQTFLYQNKHFLKQHFKFPKRPNSLGWAKLNPGAWNSVLVFHMGERPSYLSDQLLPHRMHV